MGWELSLYRYRDKMITEIVMTENSISVLTKNINRYKNRSFECSSSKIKFVDILCKCCGSNIGFNFVVLMGYWLRWLLQAEDEPYCEKWKQRMKNYRSCFYPHVETSYWLFTMWYSVLPGTLCNKIEITSVTYHLLVLIMELQFHNGLHNMYQAKDLACLHECLLLAEQSVGS